MPPVAVASSRDDRRAVEAIETHHAELAGQLETRVRALLRAVGTSDAHRLVSARDELVAWCRHELLPHAEAEQAVLYPAASGLDGLAPLIRAMSHEHGLLRHLVGRLAVETDPVILAADSGALRTLFASHVEKENELVVPALAAAAQVALAGLLEQLHHELASDRATDGRPSHPTRDHAEPHGEDASTAHGCGCEDEPADDLELDARTIPHPVRHATILGALGALGATAPGSGLVLVAPHDPLPLLAEIEQRHPGRFDVTYLERGPEAWRLRFARTGTPLHEPAA